ncbi:MAG TPA: contractile injection system protein, VgrG/Pvc8 family, partial [Gemmataceae bacterium]
MATTALQAARPLAVTTALDKGGGPPKFLARRFQADEAVSQLFRAAVDVAADKRLEFTFDQLLGTPVLVALTASGKAGTRHFHGVCRRVSQAGGDADHNHLRLDLVPQAWLLTKKAQSRIF